MTDPTLISGSGAVGRLGGVGQSAPVADPTVVSASGAVGQGAPAADPTVISGSGAVGCLGGVGQGVPVADPAVVSGSGAVGCLGGVGQGVPVADPAVIVGSDDVGPLGGVGRGAPQTDPAVISASAVVGPLGGVGRGVPVADPTLVVGSDDVGRLGGVGQGVPVADPAVVSGSDAADGTSAGSVCGCGGVGASAAGGDPGGWLSAVLGVLREGLCSLGVDRLDGRLGLVGRVESAAAALRAETVAAIAGRRGEAEAAVVVRDRLRESRSKAKRDVRLAGRLEWLPDTAEALAGGAITARQAQMIAEAAEETSIDEKELLAAAAEEAADRFGRTVRDHVNERTAGESLEERRRRQRERREFSIRAQADGMFRLSGWLDPLAGARVQTALGAEYRRLLKAEDHKNSKNSKNQKNPKKRATTAQLYADALESLATRGGKGKAPRTSLVVVADYDFVANQLANPRLYDGTPLAADEFVRL
ncbi:MAG: DUF222 domain-containing protein, partial [bacterium]|nr:DUF222 domain-containing protein [bacterium]